MKSIIVMGFFLISITSSVVLALTGDPWQFGLVAALTLLQAYLIFRGTMNLVQHVGFVYWIVRDTGKKGDPLLCTGFMRQVGPPWLTGNGIQVRVRSHILQIGFCKKQKDIDSEESGILNAMQAYYMDKKPKELSSWK